MCIDWMERKALPLPPPKWNTKYFEIIKQYTPATPTTGNNERKSGSDVGGGGGGWASEQTSKRASEKKASSVKGIYQWCWRAVVSLMCGEMNIFFPRCALVSCCSLTLSPAVAASSHFYFVFGAKYTWAFKWESISECERMDKHNHMSILYEVEKLKYLYVAGIFFCVFRSLVFLVLIFFCAVRVFHSHCVRCTCVYACVSEREDEWDESVHTLKIKRVRSSLMMCSCNVIIIIIIINIIVHIALWQYKTHFSISGAERCVCVYIWYRQTYYLTLNNRWMPQLLLLLRFIFSHFMYPVFFVPLVPFPRILDVSRCSLVVTKIFITFGRSSTTANLLLIQYKTTTTVVILHRAQKNAHVPKRKSRIFTASICSFRYAGCWLAFCINCRYV